MSIDEQKIMEEGFRLSMFNKPNNYKISEKELETINKKAYLDALQGFLKTAYQREMVRTFATDGTLPYVPKDPVLKRMLENQANALSSKPPYMMVTVNPREETTLYLLQQKVEKFVNKKSVIAYYYVYEVRTEDTGLHCHILLQYEAKPYDFKRSAKNTFKTICDSSNPHCLNFKFLELDILPQKIDYLNGSKKDSKKAGVECTIKYREKNNIAAFYESSPPLPCRATQTTIEFKKEDGMNIGESGATPHAPLGV